MKSSMFARTLLAFGCMLGAANGAYAMSGTLNAHPEMVIVPAGPGQFGSTTLAYYSEGVSQGILTIDCFIGFGELPQTTVAPGHGTFQWNYVAEGEQCTWRLRANSVEGAVLASVVVTGIHPQIPTGSITATPAKVIVPFGQPAGYTNLQWTTTNNPGGVDIISTCNGTVENVLTYGAYSGQQSALVPTASNCRFDLKVAGFNWHLANTTAKGVEEPPPGGACQMSCDHHGNQHDYRCEVLRPTDTVNYEYQWSTAAHWNILYSSPQEAHFQCPGDPGTCSSFSIGLRVVDDEGTQICVANRGGSAHGGRK